MYLRPEGKLVRLEMDTALPSNDANVRIESEKRDSTANAPPVVSRVEYDMDEQDERWLEAQNLARKDEQVEAIKPAIFEITMTQIEKEWHALEKSKCEFDIFRARNLKSMHLHLHVFRNPKAESETSTDAPSSF